MLLHKHLLGILHHRKNFRDSRWAWTKILDQIQSLTEAAIKSLILKIAVRLTQFSPVSYFYNPGKRQKSFDFLSFSGGIEMWHWTKMGYWAQTELWTSHQGDFTNIRHVKQIKCTQLYDKY